MDKEKADQLKLAFNRDFHRLTGDKQNDYVCGFDSGWEAHAVASEWTDVNERLPGEYEEVLVTDGTHKTPAYYDADGWNFTDAVSRNFSEIVAYLFIPEYKRQPKEGK